MSDHVYVLPKRVVPMSSTPEEAQMDDQLDDEPRRSPAQEPERDALAVALGAGDPPGRKGRTRGCGRRRRSRGGEWRRPLIQGPHLRDRSEHDRDRQRAVPQSEQESDPILQELVAYLRESRAELRQQWARRISEAELLRVMSEDEIFTEATEVYDNYVDALETGSVETLEAYALRAVGTDHSPWSGDRRGSWDRPAAPGRARARAVRQISTGG